MFHVKCHEVNAENVIILDGFCIKCIADTEKARK